MRVQETIKRVENLDGNLIRRDGDIYIAPINMDKFVVHLEACEKLKLCL